MHIERVFESRSVCFFKSVLFTEEVFSHESTLPMSDTFLAAATQRARELAVARGSASSSIMSAAAPPPPQPPPQSSHSDKVNALRERLAEQKRAHSATEAAAPRERPPRERFPRAEAQPTVELSDTLLGEGATAQVWLAYFGEARTEVAAKVVSKKELDRDQVGWIREEITIHKRLRHPNICTLHGSFESLSKFTLCLALCRGGTLVDTMGAALDAGEPLEDVRVRSAFVQLLGAMHYLDGLGIVHRDIKLDNLAWQDVRRTRLQLLDFGYASTTDEHRQFSGSAHFAAPEVHAADEGGPPFSCRCADVWSAGVVLYAMLATGLPFNGAEGTADERAALRAKVRAGVVDGGGVPAHRPAAARELVARMLVVDAQARATLAQVIAHEWTGGQVP